MNSSSTQLGMWFHLSRWIQVVMEGCVFSILYQTFTRTEQAIPWIFLGLTGTLVAAMILSRISERKEWSAKKQAWSFGILIFVSFLISQTLLFHIDSETGIFLLVVRPFLAVLEPGFLPDFWGFLIIIASVSRGIWVGKRAVHREQLRSSFELGLIAIMLAGLFPVSSNLAGNEGSLLFYLAISLLGMTIVRIASLSTEVGGKLPGFGGRWFAAIAGTALGAALFSIGIAWFFSGEISSILVQIAFAIGSTLLVILILLMSPLLAGLVWLTNRLFANVNLDLDAMQGISEETVNQLVEEQAARTSLLSASTIVVMRSVILITAAVVIISILVRMLRKRMESEQASLEMDSSTTRSNPSRFFTGLLERIPTIRLRDPRRAWAAARIRRVYAQFMDLCTSLDLPRDPALTPLEFLPLARSLFIENDRELDKLTTAYLQIRYGELPESEEEVQEVFDAWEKIKRQGKISLAQKKAQNQAKSQ